MGATGPKMTSAATWFPRGCRGSGCRGMSRQGWSLPQGVTARDIAAAECYGAGCHRRGGGGVTVRNVTDASCFDVGCHPWARFEAMKISAPFSQLLDDPASISGRNLRQGSRFPLSSRGSVGLRWGESRHKWITGKEGGGNPIVTSDRFIFVSFIYISSDLVCVIQKQSRNRPLQRPIRPLQRAFAASLGAVPAAATSGSLRKGFSFPSGR